MRSSIHLWQCPNILKEVISLLYKIFIFIYSSYEVLTEATIRIVIFMVMLSWPSYNMQAGCSCSGKHTASISALKMGAICYPEMSVLTYQSIWSHNSERHNMNSYFLIELTSCLYGKTCL